MTAQEIGFVGIWTDQLDATVKLFRDVIGAAAVRTRPAVAAAAAAAEGYL